MSALGFELKLLYMLALFFLSLSGLSQLYTDGLIVLLITPSLFFSQFLGVVFTSKFSEVEQVLPHSISLITVQFESC